MITIMDQPARLILLLKTGHLQRYQEENQMSNMLPINHLHRLKKTTMDQQTRTISLGEVDHLYRYQEENQGNMLPISHLHHLKKTTLDQQTRTILLWKTDHLHYRDKCQKRNIFHLIHIIHLENLKIITMDQEARTILLWNHLQKKYHQKYHQKNQLKANRTNIHCLCRQRANLEDHHVIISVQLHQTVSKPAIIGLYRAKGQPYQHENHFSEMPSRHLLIRYPRRHKGRSWERRTEKTMTIQ